MSNLPLLHSLQQIFHSLWFLFVLLRSHHPVLSSHFLTHTQQQTASWLASQWNYRLYEIRGMVVSSLAAKANDVLLFSELVSPASTHQLPEAWPHIQRGANTSKTWECAGLLSWRSPSPDSSPGAMQACALGHRVISFRHPGEVCWPEGGWKRWPWRPLLSHPTTFLIKSIPIKKKKKKSPHCRWILYHLRASLAAQMLKKMRETQVHSLVWESPGGENGNPLPYSCLENPINRGAWWITVHRVTRGKLNWATNTTPIRGPRKWRSPPQPSTHDKYKPKSALASSPYPRKQDLLAL